MGVGGRADDEKVEAREVRICDRADGPDGHVERGS
jgi:hypothetical protein